MEAQERSYSQVTQEPLEEEGTAGVNVTATAAAQQNYPS